MYFNHPSTRRPAIESSNHRTTSIVFLAAETITWWKIRTKYTPYSILCFTPQCCVREWKFWFMLRLRRLRNINTVVRLIVHDDPRYSRPLLHPIITQSTTYFQSHRTYKFAMMGVWCGVHNEWSKTINALPCYANNTYQQVWSDFVYGNFQIFLKLN